MRRVLSWIALAVIFGITIGYGFLINKWFALTLAVSVAALTLTCFHQRILTFKLLCFTMMGFCWFFAYTWFSMDNFNTLSEAINNNAQTNQLAERKLLESSMGENINKDSEKSRLLKLNVIGADANLKGSITLFCRMDLKANKVLGARTLALHIIKKKEKNRNKGFKKEQVLKGHSFNSQVHPTIENAPSFIGRQIFVKKSDIKLRKMTDDSVWSYDDSRIDGTFNYKLYIKSSGLLGGCSVDQDSVVLSSRQNYNFLTPYYVLWSFLLKMKINFYKSLPNKWSSGIIAGMTLGQKKGIPYSVAEEFTINGTGHVLAISGLHIGIIYGLFLSIRKRIYGQFTAGLFTWLFVGFIFSYGVITGWSPSVFRAIMITYLHMAAHCLKEAFDFLTAIAFTALISIWINPYCVFSSSFIMSFIAVSSIAVIGPAISDFVAPVVRKVYHFIAVSFNSKTASMDKYKIDQLASVVSATCAVQLGMAPYIAYSYYVISPTSSLINIPVLFIAGCMLPVSMVALILSYWMGSSLFHSMADIFAQLLIKINHYWADYGSFYVFTGAPPLFLMVLVYLGLLLVSSESMVIATYNWRSILQKCSWLKGAAMFMFIVLATSSLYGLCHNSLGNKSMVFLGTKAGFALHLVNDGENILINGGGSQLDNDGSKVLLPYLAHRQIRLINKAFYTKEGGGGSLGLFQLSKKMNIKSTHKPVTSNLQFNTWYHRGRLTIKGCAMENLNNNIKDSNGKNETISIFLIHIKKVPYQNKQPPSSSEKILILGYIDENDLMVFHKSIDKLKKIDIVQAPSTLVNTKGFSRLVKRLKPKTIVVTPSLKSTDPPKKQKMTYWPSVSSHSSPSILVLEKDSYISDI